MIFRTAKGCVKAEMYAGVWAVFLFLFLGMVGNTTANQPCASKWVGIGAMVCVCNRTYCDTLDPVSLPPKGFFLKYESSKSGQRLDLSVGTFQPNCTSSGLEYIFNASDRHQCIRGFGGSHTDASAINILNLSPAAQDHLLRSYFSSTGIEYNLLRMPIGSSDFSTRPYAYDDILYDFDLKYFHLVKEDTEFRIPLLHRIMALSEREISIVASPWTGPAWLKTNENVKGKGRLKGEAGDKYHKTWANYLIRFLDEYAEHNITFWAITPQNEPALSLYAMHNFPTINYSPEEQRDFIIQDLGPALTSSAHRDVLIIIHDDLRVNLPNWAKVVLGNSSAAKYVSGIGVHWYLDDVIPARFTLDPTHKQYPGYFLLYTEACNGFRPWDTVVAMGSWNRGVLYSSNIIENLQHEVTGWIDWNMVLDLKGGPNWVDNFVDSPVIVDAEKDEFYKQPMFYHLAHFSKFIPPGSIRVGLPCKSFFSCRLETVAFLRPDGTAAVVVLNDCFYDVEFSISDSQVGFLEDVAEAYSIQTYLWERA